MLELAGLAAQAWCTWQLVLALVLEMVWHVMQVCMALQAVLPLLEVLETYLQHQTPGSGLRSALACKLMVQPVQPWLSQLLAQDWV